MGYVKMHGFHGNRLYDSWDWGVGLQIQSYPLLPVFISSVIQFDKLFHPVVLYENYLICMFMNINEKFCN